MLHTNVLCGSKETNLDSYCVEITRINVDECFNSECIDKLPVMNGSSNENSNTNDKAQISYSPHKR